MRGSDPWTLFSRSSGETPNKITAFENYLMQTTTLKSDALLLVTATIWGFAFVAQRVGMDHVGPFTFNGIRFALGSLVLLPMIIRNSGRRDRFESPHDPVGGKALIAAGALTGLALFAGASLQQVGLVYTTAGNAGFITGLYVVIVPILGLIWGQRPGGGTWVGAFLAAVGLYLLSVTDNFTIAFGDLLELIGAFFWAGHVLIIGWLSPRTDSLKLACFQYAACSALSLITAVIFETMTMDGIVNALVPILYGGVMSVGIAYTLQVVAQRHAHPAHAAILLSLEAVFAALGGWILLGERLSARGFTGCALMLAGMLLSQLWELYRRKPATSSLPGTSDSVTEPLS
ncbi:Permease of the drug/metabolite transporter (DMT) superfamily [Olavius algarvensis associated proteobacterium Delta 3]|nr:Permease of the drug/metabolite transporter (DMT) superfamily [Olavius algarvensis associated proteobacterium Delta 3]